LIQTPRRIEVNVTHHLWKGVLLGLAISALSLASYGSGRESSGLADGLYAAPDTDPGASGDPAKGRSLRTAADSAGRLNYAAAKGAPASWKPSRAEQMWLTVLAGAGILVSLAAVAYVWRARVQLSKAGGAVILAVKREADTDSGGAEAQASTAQRRAA
jgi:hypothetical protein